MLDKFMSRKNNQTVQADTVARLAFVGALTFAEMEISRSDSSGWHECQFHNWFDHFVHFYSPEIRAFSSTIIDTIQRLADSRGFCMVIYVSRARDRREKAFTIAQNKLL